MPLASPPNLYSLFSPLHWLCSFNNSLDAFLKNSSWLCSVYITERVLPCLLLFQRPLCPSKVLRLYSSDFISSNHHSAPLSFCLIQSFPMYFLLFKYFLTLIFVIQFLSLFLTICNGMFLLLQSATSKMYSTNHSLFNFSK